MKRNEIVKKINNNFYNLKQAKEHLYRGKLFVVATENRIKSFHKTKRGAENKVKNLSRTILECKSSRTT